MSPAFRLKVRFLFIGNSSDDFFVSRLENLNAGIKPAATRIIL